MAERVGCLAQGHTSSKRQNISHLNDFSRYLSPSPPPCPPEEWLLIGSCSQDSSHWVCQQGMGPGQLVRTVGGWFLLTPKLTNCLSIQQEPNRESHTHTHAPPPPTYLGFNYEMPLKVFSLNRNTEFSFPLLFLNKTFNLVLFHGLEIKCKV